MGLFEKPQQNEPDFDLVEVKIPVDETDEDEVLSVNFNENAGSLGELLYDCYLHSKFDVRLIHKQNKDFILYFKRDQVFVKNLKDESNIDLSLMEIQCIWMALKIELSQKNFFKYETIGYEII